MWGALVGSLSISKISFESFYTGKPYTPKTTTKFVHSQIWALSTGDVIILPWRQSAKWALAWSHTRLDSTQCVYFWSPSTSCWIFKNIDRCTKFPMVGEWVPSWAIVLRGACPWIALLICSTIPYCSEFELHESYKTTTTCCKLD